MATAPEWAIISVYDKKGIVQLANALIQSSKVQVAASDGTYDHLINNGVPARKISSITGFSELLGGRVKTLHPSIFAGILADSTEEDMQQLRENGWRRVRFVVCNFYPFEETVSALGVTDNEVLANIDIGGVALLRAAAKNYQSVTVISDLSDYSLIINEITSLGSNDTTLETRQMLAVKVHCLCCA
ncbi:MGS-like domain protein [Trichuris suis]|nr:MGS-like domain protein [Trichuris suis]